MQGQFETNMSGEYVFADETPGTAFAFRIDSQSLDLQGNPFRLNDQTIILYSPFDGVATISETSDLFNMFVGSGTVVLQNIIVSITGAGSSVYNGLVPSLSRNTIRESGVIFSGCTEIGNMDSFDEVIVRGCREFFCGTGRTFSGTYDAGVVFDGYDIVGSTGTIFTTDITFETDQFYFLNIRNRSSSGATVWNIADEGNFGIDSAFQIRDAVNTQPNVNMGDGN